MSFVLKINDRFLNRRVKFFNEFKIELKHDSVGSVFDFKFFFDPENQEHIELTTPGHFHECTIEFEGELLLTGFILNHNFIQSSQPQLTSFAGYSLPGVLEDCEIPISQYPLQFDGLSLASIARKLIRPFRLDMVIDPAVASKMNKSFDTSTASESSSVKDFLVELASQKNIIISHNEKGNVLFTEAKTDVDPIISFDLRESTPVGTSFAFDFNGQGMHKYINLQKQASEDGGNAGQARIKNPLVAGNVFRETVKSQSSGDDNDTVDASRRALANELTGAKLTITTDTWVLNGKIVRPNSIIEIIAPKLFIFVKTRFFIESISFTGNQSTTTSVWNCVLPEVYNNKIPKNIFAGINLHPIPTE